MSDTKPIGVAYRDQELDGSTISNSTISGGTISGAAITGGTIDATGLSFAVETVAAAGSAATTATPITVYGIVTVSGADGTKGVKLPTAAAGRVVILKNLAAAVLKVYPGTDDKINGGTATTGSLNMAASTSAVYAAYDGENWFSVPLLPS
jgi:hypothetical protein